MHHSDRVKLQYGIQQDIPNSPKCMEEYHTSKASDQWKFLNWKDHYKQERRQWQNRRNTVLQGFVMPDECKPSRGYMDWYRSVSTLYLSQNRLLFDPRNQPAPSNFQHTGPSTTYTQQPTSHTQQHTYHTQQPFNPTQPPYTPSQHYSQQYQPFNPPLYNTHHHQQQQHYNSSQIFTPSTSYTQPHTPHTIHHNPYAFTQTTQQEHNFQTPQEPYVPIMQTSMPPYAQPNWNYEGTRLSYGSATDFISDDALEDFINPTNEAGPSNVDQGENRVPQRRSTRLGFAPSCGTGHRLPRPGQNHG
jgi:hypothetical protein